MFVADRFKKPGRLLIILQGAAGDILYEVGDADVEIGTRQSRRVIQFLFQFERSEKVVECLIVIALVHVNDADIVERIREPLLVLRELKILYGAQMIPQGALFIVEPAVHHSDVRKQRRHPLLIAELFFQLQRFQKEIECAHPGTLLSVSDAGAGERHCETSIVFQHSGQVLRLTSHSNCFLRIGLAVFLREVEHNAHIHRIPNSPVLPALEQCFHSPGFAVLLRLSNRRAQQRRRCEYRQQNQCSAHFTFLSLWME